VRLDTEFVKLPLRFEAARLAEEVAAVPEEDWRPHPQGHPGNSALPLIASGGDPGNDATKGPMRPTPHLARLPYLRQALASFGTVFGRTRLMRLDGNAEATPHCDTNYYWLRRVRLHLPLVTRPEVEFLCGERRVHMAAGEAWVFDTWKTHNVLNPHPTRRIHLVADTVGSAAFWDLVARGERPFAPGGSTEAPREVPFDPAIDPDLAFETVNQPVVMSPWEQEAHLALLFGDLDGAPADRLAELRAELDRFRLDWAALWALYGEAAAGWPAYGERLAELDRRLGRFAGQLRLGNGSEAIEIVRQMLVRPALNPDLTSQRLAGQAPAASPAPAVFPTSRSAVSPTASPAPLFERPIFLVSSPRSGSSLLFETIAQARDLWTIGGESHAAIEEIEGLHPRRRDWESNRLAAADATPEIARRLTASFRARLRDFQGQTPGLQASGLRLLEKTPKNSLRVPFLAAAFPDARFVYLYRDPRETVSSMLDAWRSGRFVTYPDLPGWTGPPWSLLLVPGWRELAGLPLAEIAARQWSIATARLVEDLEALPAASWCVASYDRLVAEPQAEIVRLCEFLELDWDRELQAPLPPSRHTLTSPEPEKWRHNAEELRPVLPLLEESAARARDLFGEAPAVRPARRRSRAETPRPISPPTGPAVSASPAADPAEEFRSVFTASLPALLSELRSSLLVSTYQSGRLIAVRAENGELNTHFRSFASPMGIAVGRKSLALGTLRHVWSYQNQPEVGRRLSPPDRHDAVFLPRRAYVTGDVRIHELAFAGEELWFVATRFSCLATLDGEHSFVPRWRPPFVSAYSPDDRCHLNGLCVIDDRLRFATALGTTDTPHGWRENKASGGVLIDIESREIVARGLSMPHSPRWYAGRLWVLESAKGEVGVVDLGTGRVETIARLPGFTRGLAFLGPYAFVGLSQVRETNLFSDLPLSQRVAEKQCGVWVLDVRTGALVGFVRFEGRVQEIFDVQALRGIRYPEIAEPDSDLIATSFALPEAALAEVAR
jgi:uncharacterized protein (TIGR03032 family)